MMGRLLANAGDRHWSAIPVALAALCALPVSADNWSGSLRSKMQTDNRYSPEGDYTGELWAQLAYVNPRQQLNARVSTISRFSTDIYRNRQNVYQAYLEKDLTSLPMTVRGGRFERSDSLGLYLLDGAAATYRFHDLPFSIDLYGGRPVRIDHVRSLEGAVTAGAEGLFKFKPHWSFINDRSQINDFDLRLGLQTVGREQTSFVSDAYGIEQAIVGNQFDADESAAAGQRRTETRTTVRFNGTAHVAGHVLAQDKPAEVFLQGSYDIDKDRLENFYLDGWWDVLKRLRLRNTFESYRPRQPFVTFRDRFYSAYALGEQQVWRGSAQYRQNDRLGYSMGFQYAARDTGYNGGGFNAGISYQWRPALTLRGEVDHLELDSNERATSVYLAASHAWNAKLRYGLNLAWRQEEKSLYGQNQARGIEGESQYMVDNSLVLALKGSYINNSASALRNEYLAAVQLTYYFDRFQPKK